jgi:hypothetical protein
MQVRISSRIAGSYLLQPSPIVHPKSDPPIETLIPLQHRTVRRRRLQRRRLRMKAMIERPMISNEATTEDDLLVVGAGDQITNEACQVEATTDPKTWALAPESSTEDPDNQSVEHKTETKSSECSCEGSTKCSVNSALPMKGLGDTTSLLGKKKRTNRDVTSLVSPIRSSKRQRFSF